MEIRYLLQSEGLIPVLVQPDSEEDSGSVLLCVSFRHGSVEVARMVVSRQDTPLCCCATRPREEVLELDEPSFVMTPGQSWLAYVRAQRLKEIARKVALPGWDVDDELLYWKFCEQYPADGITYEEARRRNRTGYTAPKPDVIDLPLRFCAEQYNSQPVFSVHGTE